MNDTGKLLAQLLYRDLGKLVQQMEGFPPALLWTVAPGVANSAGNLALHLEGNLREYIGRQMGKLDYQRDRAREFSAKDVPREELVTCLRDLRIKIPTVVEGMDVARLSETFPDQPLGVPMTNLQFLVHLHGHLNYHLGQIDYLRRILVGAGGGAIDYVRLREE
ncbi:hypothetical protein F183_A24740 [Bryobacterales bacterium F-183]|nr:hypothetical protein F183_A24740 [Bryobacterales bacterium F-183]